MILFKTIFAASVVAGAPADGFSGRAYPVVAVAATKLEGSCGVGRLNGRSFRIQLDVGFNFNLDAGYQVPWFLLLVITLLCEGELSCQLCWK